MKRKHTKGSMYKKVAKDLTTQPLFKLKCLGINKFSTIFAAEEIINAFVTMN